MAITYKKIASVTVGSGGAASIDFTTIDQSYTDLILKVSARDNLTGLYVDDLKIVLNSDTNTANYSQRAVYGNSSTAASNTNTNLGSFAVWGLNGTSTTASTFSNSEIYFANYSGSTQKSISADTVVENNSSGANLSWIAMVAGLYNQTTAITTITLSSYGSKNFAEHSTATLYGISNS